MNTDKHRFPYGKGHIEIEVSGDLLEARFSERVADETAAVWEALERPIGSGTLADIVRSGERVAIIVNDITRLARADLLLPPIVESLNRAGIPDGDIFIVFALGIHRRQTDDERRLIVGEEIFRRIRCFDHISTDDSSLVTIGTTSFGNVIEINREVWEADRIILTGEIIYHLIAGYSGGRKSLVPGVAGFRTTTFNHRMIFDPRCRSGALDDNPAHLDLLEGARMASPDFLVNVILDGEGHVIRVVAGHFEEAHRTGCRVVDEMLRVDVAEPYDVVVASAGGFPVDIDLRQAHKGLENAVRALRPGGSILFYAECPHGAGIQSFRDYIFRYANDREMEAALQTDFVVGGHKAYWIARLGRLFDVHLVSSLDREFVERCGFRHVPVEEHQARVHELTTGASRVAVVPHSGFVLPC